MDALVNQETSFFRDAQVFEMLAEAVAAAERDSRRARIWCAGCSTGQEPLSLAMKFAERHAGGAPMPEILATDVSDAGIARARSGRFLQFDIKRGLPVRRMIRCFDTAGGDWIAKPELLGMIAFRRMNLVSDPPPSGQFDIVLCRNMLLYSSADTKSAVFPKIAKAMRPEGILVMGVGQTVIGQTYVFAPSMRFRGFYEKVVQA
ncbi:CheR family methyltransferase [Sphingomonas faeni]|uniref:CheR family methyltransferase n=1 Tax=Sphingomonas faeni TaxID=185950 RepID=UPI002787BA29|nr:CheR family methyltransferase [Sphingomonas faeni]MDQ0836914.1 chemotaxis protein methyltransferase CheR [Sphingomonas faeni]